MDPIDPVPAFPEPQERVLHKLLRVVSVPLTK
jgi:hypothetical protein